MHHAESATIAQEHGSNGRHILLTLNEDGSLKIHVSDWGPEVAKSWGRDEYEYWVYIPREAAGKLAFDCSKKDMEEI